MQEETGATIAIEEVDGVGKVQVSGPNKDVIDAAMSKIRAIVAVPEVGQVYEGTVRSIMPYGCFVEGRLAPHQRNRLEASGDR